MGLLLVGGAPGRGRGRGTDIVGCLILERGDLYTMTRTADDSFVFVIGLIWALGFGKFCDVIMCTRAWWPRKHVLPHWVGLSGLSFQWSF